eukprot:6720500-Pyramimonas_sp.AAC.1
MAAAGTIFGNSQQENSPAWTPERRGSASGATCSFLSILKATGQKIHFVARTLIPKCTEANLVDE